MFLAAAAICIAVSRPAEPYDGEPPKLRVPRPTLPVLASSAKGFAPPGWRVERQVSGDLDGDGRPDLALVLKGNDPHCLVSIDGASSPLDTNPRVLLVAFGSPTGFRLHLANTTVIPRVDDRYMDDPFDGPAFAIRGNVLRLGLTYWRSMGGWTTWNSTLAFRWDGRRLRLIGYDRKSVQRNSGETEAISVDFLNGRAKLTTGSIEDDVDDVTHWRRVDIRQGLALDTIGDGLAFEPALTRGPR